MCVELPLPDEQCTCIDTFSASLNCATVLAVLDLRMLMSAQTSVATRYSSSTSGRPIQRTVTVHSSARSSGGEPVQVLARGDVLALEVDGGHEEGLGGVGGDEARGLAEAVALHRRGGRGGGEGGSGVERRGGGRGGGGGG